MGRPSPSTSRHRTPRPSSRPSSISSTSRPSARSKARSSAAAGNDAASRSARATRATVGTPPVRSWRTTPSASRTPAASSCSMSRRARPRSRGVSAEIQRGSGAGGGGSGSAFAAWVALDFPVAVGPAVFLNRSASGDSGAAVPRAASTAALASVRERNGPRTRGRPRSSVCSPSTRTHVPDWGSIVNRSSRVCQRPPPSRLSEPASSVFFAAICSG